MLISSRRTSGIRALFVIISKYILENFPYRSLLFHLKKYVPEHLRDVSIVGLQNKSALWQPSDWLKLIRELEKNLQ
jgi:hypothetical protein